MHDEYIYASQARSLPFEAHPFSNYLFSWVMGLTQNCSADFYGCAKFINVVMFVVGVSFTLLIAARLLAFGWAIFAASVTALSPLVIQTSFFMPETMYFMVMTMVLWLALLAAEKGLLWVWGVAGITLGMAALVKPHAIFLLPALIVYASIIELRRNNSVLAKAVPAGTSVLVGFLVSKLGLGFAFAGPAGLRLFGGYGSPLEGIARVVGDGAESESASSSALEVLVVVAGTHLLAHVAVMALLAGLPLLLTLRVLVRVLRSKEQVGQASSFLILVAMVTLSMLLLVPAFEGYVTASGDDHSLRLILRYYEFLIPSYLISALLMDRFVESGRVSRWVQSGSVALLAVGFAALYPPLIDTKFADSSFLGGLEDAPVVFLFLSLAVAASGFYWALKPDNGAQLIARVLMPSVIVLSMFLSQNLLISSSSTPAFFDVAGQTAGQALKSVAGDKIGVVGQLRTQVFTSMFWIDKAGISELYVPEGESLDLDSLNENQYYLILGNVTIVGDFRELASGDRFVVLEKLGTTTE